MTTYVAPSRTAVYTDDATFRSFGAAISLGFSSAGLVQTSDTGQINWATVTKPATASTLVGYEIWRFNDSLQATAPIYLRIGYYSGGNATGGNLALWVNIGTATNGAGTLTGYVMAASPGVITNNSVVQTNSYTAWSFRMCHAAGTFTAVSDPEEASNNSSPFQFGVSRTIDSSGTLTTTGAYLWHMSGTGLLQRSLNFVTSTTYGGTYPNAAPPGDLSNYDSGSTSYVLPHYACIPNPVLVPGVVTVRTSIAEGTTFTLALNGGVARTYLVWGTSVRFSNFYPNLFGSAMAGLTNEGVYSCLGVVWE